MPAWIYIMTNKRNGTLYIGVTTDIARRVYEHRNGLVEGFSKKYGLKKLVYAESCDSITDAIAREKTMKAWQRRWKIRLIEEANPDWDDWGQRNLM